MAQGPPISTFIPESIGSKDILFENAPVVGTVDFYDGVIIFSPAFIYMLIGDIFTPAPLEPYNLIFALLLALLGLSLLLLKPKHMSLYDWFTVQKDFRQREKDLSKNYTNENGKPFESMDIVPDDDTRKLTKADKVYPERNAIELDDGTMVSIIEFTGSNLDMGSQENIVNTVMQYSQRMSSQLQNDIQFYMPMRPVSTETTSQRYKNQLDNLDVETEQDEFLEVYLEDRQMWVDNLSSSSFIREQYVVVTVEPSEVYSSSSQTSNSGLDAIPGGELIKDIYLGLTGNQAIESEKERKRKQLRELAKRRETIGNILSVGPGNSYNIVESKKCTGLIKEFWEGERIKSDEMDALSNKYNFSLSQINEIRQTGDKND